MSPLTKEELTRIIDCIVSKYIANIKNKDRSVLSIISQSEIKELSFCLLLLECISLLEAYLNRSGEFAGRRSNFDNMQAASISPKRIERMNTLCGILEIPVYSQSSFKLDMATHVAQIWKWLFESMVFAQEFGKLSIANVAFNRTTERQAHLMRQTRKISRLFGILTSDIKAFGYHGSIGSNDHIQFLSDCDALVILNAGIVEDPVHLRQIQTVCLSAFRIMCKIDYVQHHGVFVIPEELFAFYPENYFPTILYPFSSFDICSETSATFNIYFSRWASFIRVLQSCRYIEQNAPSIRIQNYYQFHMVLQVAQLLPCFVVACCKNSLNKRDAILWFMKRCSSDSAEFLHNTMELRKRWTTLWPSRHFIRRIAEYVRKDSLLKDKTIEFFSGADQLKQSLSTFADDCASIARECIRRNIYDS